MSRANTDWGSTQSGWTAIASEYGSLSIRERHVLNTASFGVQYVQTGQQPLGPFEPPPPRSPPDLRVLPPNDMRRMHLAGNQGVISSPQPCTTDNVKNHLYVPPAAPKEEPDMVLPRDYEWRKAFDISSGIMQSPRMLKKSTQSPSREIFSDSWGKFPFQDSCLDRHVKQKPQVAQESEVPAAPAFRSPRARFEPPARPGATFRRRREKNYSDLFSHSPPTSPGRGAIPRADANQLNGSFQDSRTEVARRNGEFRPLRMRSADPGSPRSTFRDFHSFDRESLNASSLRSPGARSRLERGAAGRGGGSGGDIDVVVATAEERAAAGNSQEAARAAWSNTSPRNDHHLFDAEAGAQGVVRFESTASEAAQRYKDDMASYAPGSAFTGFGEERPRPRAPPPPRSKMTSSSPVIGLWNQRGAHPRSPRARTYGDTRGGGSDDDMDLFPAKAVARERFRRQMSSDSVFRFDSK